jgi:hypothetical protein
MHANTCDVPLELGSETSSLELLLSEPWLMASAYWFAQVGDLLCLFYVFLVLLQIVANLKNKPEAMEKVLFLRVCVVGWAVVFCREGFGGQKEAAAAALCMCRCAGMPHHEWQHAPMLLMTSG